MTTTTVCVTFNPGHHSLYIYNNVIHVHFTYMLDANNEHSVPEHFLCLFHNIYFFSSVFFFVNEPRMSVSGHDGWWPTTTTTVVAHATMPDAFKRCPP